jgi:hypothetical protein
VLAFVAAPAAALVLTAMMPVTLAVAAVAVFGVAHLALETRYVVGRASARVSGAVLAGLLVPLTVIALLRLFPQGRVGTRTEALVALGLVAAAWGWCLRERPAVGAAGVLVVCVLAALAWQRPDLYLVAVVQLHNVTPVAFLWEWSRDRGSRIGRSLFRGAQLGWAFVVPMVILLGGLDGHARPSLMWTGDRSAQAITHAYSPAGWAEPWPSRLLMVFCFGQLMHYVIWCGYVPVVARDDHARATRVGPVGPVFRARLFVPLAALTAVVLGLLQLSSGRIGRRWYSAVASYHAYLEYPVLVVLLLALVGASVSLPRRGP